MRVRGLLIKLINGLLRVSAEQREVPYHKRSSLLKILIAAVKVEIYNHTVEWRPLRQNCKPVFQLSTQLSKQWIKENHRITWTGIESVTVIPVLIDVCAPRVGLSFAHALMMVRAANS